MATSRPLPFAIKEPWILGLTPCFPDGSEESAIARLASDLKSGKWDEVHGDLRRRSTFKGALKLICNLPDEPEE